MLFICLAMGIAGAQEPPGEHGTFDGFAAEGALAEVAAPKANSHCANKKNCWPTTLSSGDVVLVYRTEGERSCGYLQRRDVAGATWLLSRDIQMVRVDPQPPPSAWMGNWAGGEDRVGIQAGKEAGTLQVKGSAEWPGANDNVLFGQVDGSALPAGNHQKIMESAGCCQVELTLMGKYIVASDNNKCGGMSVRFDGVWKRR